jgi:hypothetical protein
MGALLPCPFCGELPNFREYHTRRGTIQEVKCEVCDIIFNSRRCSVNVQVKWNERH